MINNQNNDKIKAAATKQREVCRAAFRRANLPDWAIDKCMAQAEFLINIIIECWSKNDKEKYDETINQLTKFIQDKSKLSWNSVPPPIPRFPGEDVDAWTERCYLAWLGDRI